MLNWESLQTACLSCTSCPLSQTRHNVVFGVGPQDAEVMFVGEGPGENEDLQGEPFVGAAGKFLDEMLSIIDLGRENCYITNIVKCRPPRNRDPMQTEQDACIGFLRAQTKLIQPKIIVCLGRIAAMRLIRPDFKISCEHGQFTEKGGILFTALYHPSALLRDETKRPDTVSDLKALQSKVREVCTRTLEPPRDAPQGASFLLCGAGAPKASPRETGCGAKRSRQMRDDSSRVLLQIIRTSCISYI